jgi:hypothetical protein
VKVKFALRVKFFALQKGRKKFNNSATQGEALQFTIATAINSRNHWFQFTP